MLVTSTTPFLISWFSSYDFYNHYLIISSCTLTRYPFYQFLFFKSSNFISRYYRKCISPLKSISLYPRLCINFFFSGITLSTIHQQCEHGQKLSFAFSTYATFSVEFAIILGTTRITTQICN